MNLLVAIIAVLSVQGSQGRPAPSDVPRNHWAFKDVDELFRAGLLDGYPTQGVAPLVLDRKLKQDQSYVRRTLARMKSEGLLVGYPDGLSGRRAESRFEDAVAAHAVYSNICHGGRTDADAIAEVPNVVKLISMFEGELTKLGADVPKAVRELNEIWLRHDAPFRG